MKLRHSTKLFLSALLVFLFTGCGSSTIKDQNIQPTHLSKFNDEALPLNFYDFASNVMIKGAINDKNLKLTVNAYDVNVSDFSHMQIYIDVDLNASSGLSMGVEPYSIVGADYMVEDNKLFASVSSDKWEWQYICDINNTFCVGSKGKGEYKQRLFIDRDLLTRLPEQASEVRVSLEPIDWDWSDTNNYLPSKVIELEDL